MNANGAKRGVHRWNGDGHMGWMSIRWIIGAVLIAVV